MELTTSGITSRVSRLGVVEGDELALMGGSRLVSQTPPQIEKEEEVEFEEDDDDSDYELSKKNKGSKRKLSDASQVLGERVYSMLL